MRIIIVVSTSVSRTMNTAPAVYASSRWRERSKIIIDDERGRSRAADARVASRHASGAAAAEKIADNCGFHPKPRFYPRTSAMDFSIKACDWTKGSSNGFLTGKSDCIVIGVFESQTLSGAALEIDVATKGLADAHRQGRRHGRQGRHHAVPARSVGHRRVARAAGRSRQAGRLQSESLRRSRAGRMARAARHQDRAGHVHAGATAGARTHRPTGACAPRSSRCAN